MKTIQISFLIAIVFAVLATVLSSGISVIANVRGKKYSIVAETVEEFTEKAEQMAELESGQQSVLFRGKVLSPTDRLEDIGVQENDVLNVLKGRKTRAPIEQPDALDSMDFSPDEVAAPAAGAGAMGGMGGFPGMGGGMGGGGMPDEAAMQKAMEQMDTLLDSNFIEEYFGDDEKLEKARVNMLENLDQYDNAMPGFKEQAREIASDPLKWREAMTTAKNQMLEMKKHRDAARQKAKDEGSD